MAFGITTAIPDILQHGFEGSQIIVLDSSTARTTFMRNVIADRYGSDMVYPQTSVPTQPQTDPGPSTVRAVHQSTGLVDSVDSGALEHSEGEPSATHHSTDTIGHVEVSLGSRDTPDRDMIEDDTVRSMGHDDSLTVESLRDEVVATVSMQPIGILESFSRTVYSSEGQVAMGVSDARRDASHLMEVDRTTETRPSMEMDREVTLSGAGISTSLDRSVRPNVGGSEMLPTRGLAVETDSTLLTFDWALADRGMRLAADGFFYDHDGVRYRRHGVPGRYTYEQAASIMQAASPVQDVPSPMADAMVARALEYADPPTPSEIRAMLQDEHVLSDEGQDEGTQSSERIPETQFTLE